MSNVRISNGSPSLERMEARQSDYPKPSACRNLFGPVDHEELTRDLKTQRQAMEEEFQQRWNFDIKNHCPLEGRFQWEAVYSKDVPDFYSRPPRRPKNVCNSGNIPALDLNGNHHAMSFVGSQGTAESRHSVDKNTETPECQTEPLDRCTGQRKRAATEDSSPQNKKANTTEGEMSEESPSVSTVEQTPKKSSPRRHQT
ncbi:cyclin dependent kinase inhibitor 1Bb [Latimeria chalumnae]|uniref:Cyclin-dependent kinase inhibitor 1B n=1 Tax=Latimeria chalumnae TaxID=7897 RepID=H3AWA7_LATCH|nr:PREDICTED: cyclin-dependent kinase inhibitor 1B [Latimeria chalumnae]XP_006004207.1 PREDICTED: cyclin-dependent kinase inhibitor 1B [Latimeria chalumnae]|eukprot:XP_006004206.1 PREDICTED: cyclin-dependent kinase inhibitor 1B [Latimeria chalumnae]